MVNYENLYFYSFIITSNSSKHKDLYIHFNGSNPNDVGSKSKNVGSIDGLHDNVWLSKTPFSVEVTIFCPTSPVPFSLAHTWFKGQITLENLAQIFAVLLLISVVTVLVCLIWFRHRIRFRCHDFSCCPCRDRNKTSSSRFRYVVQITKIYLFHQGFNFVNHLIIRNHKLVSRLVHNLVILWIVLIWKSVPTDRVLFQIQCCPSTAKMSLQNQSVIPHPHHLTATRIGQSQNQLYGTIDRSKRSS